MKKILIAFLLFFIWQEINAQTTNQNTDTNLIQTPDRHKIIKGVVLDEKTRKPVPFATIRIEGSNKGTIAGKDGTFRLPKGNFINKSDVKITSMGYHTKIVTLDLRKDTATIFLRENPIELNAALVIGKIDVNEIIRRAIRKKDENRRKYNTMQGLLYSKFSLDMSKISKQLLSSMNASSNTTNDTININFSLKYNTQKREDSLTALFLEGFIGETFSQRFIDVEREIDKTIIVNRRQTANMPAMLNRVVLEKFIDFSQDKIELIDAKIIAPLHKNALTHYKFELLERKLYEDKYIYVIKVIPNTKLYPTFEGTISIIEGTYQLIEARLKPSASTKIHLIENIEWYEKFEDVGDGIWYPTYMENKAYFNMKLFPLIPPMEFEWSLVGIFSDVIVNQPLPESFHYNGVNYKIDNDPELSLKGKEIFKSRTSSEYDAEGNEISKNVAFMGTITLPDADSTKKEYWEDNALITLTEKEQEIYATIDTVAKELNINIDSTFETGSSNIKPKNKFSFNWIPTGRWNRVESCLIGLTSNITVPYTKLSGTGTYSLGQHRWFGNTNIEFGTGLTRTNIFGITNTSSKPRFSIGAGIFSKVNIFGNSFDNAKTNFNTISFLWFHRDHFDYFRTDGWNTQAKFDYKKFYFSAIYENRRDFGLDKKTDKTLYSTKKEFRDNPLSEAGEFQLIRLSSSLGNNITSLLEGFQYKLNVDYQYGIRDANQSKFSQINCTASTQIPVFETGYGNIFLFLSATAGWTDNNIPVQHLFVIKRSSLISNLVEPSNNTFITAYEKYFGGTEYFTYHIRLNLRDWWWRLLHLPRIKGRGLELSLAAITGRFFNKADTELSNLYSSTSTGYYTEAGFRIGRIPIPGTDFIYWSLETRIGVGEYAKGRYGFLLNFNLPFSF